MSTIHILPQVAGPAGKALQMERLSVPPRERSDKPQPSDQDMMYAWSIGVTTAARVITQMQRREECPPEVYIG